MVFGCCCVRGRGGGREASKRILKEAQRGGGGGGSKRAEQLTPAFLSIVLATLCGLLLVWRARAGRIRGRESGAVRVAARASDARLGVVGLQKGWQRDVDPDDDLAHRRASAHP